jgi:hypothetical protein
MKATKAMKVLKSLMPVDSRLEVQQKRRMKIAEPTRGGGCGSCCCPALLLDQREFLLHGVGPGAVLPREGPILRDLGVDARADRAQDVLSGVLLVLALGHTVALKVVEHDARVGSDVAEIHSLSTPWQQAVEVLEQEGVRLVDGAHEENARVRELADELDNVVGRLRVETGGGGSSRKMISSFLTSSNSNRQALSLLDRDTPGRFRGRQ